MNRVELAARRAKRDPAEIQLIAVSKTISVGEIEIAYEEGLRVFAENRAQELWSKSAEMPSDCEWHMIGAVQTNKVRRLASIVSLWHTVDREALVLEIARRRPHARVLIQVNVGAEAQKAGCLPGDLAALVTFALSAGLDVRGLMCIPPASKDPRLAFESVQRSASEYGLREVSMGMTNDFEVAIECGSTMVRVGSAIFGPRPTFVDARN